MRFFWTLPKHRGSLRRVPSKKQPRRDATGGGRAWLKDFKTDLKKYFVTSKRGRKIAKSVRPFNPKTNQPTSA